MARPTKWFFRRTFGSKLDPQIPWQSHGFSSLTDNRSFLLLPFITYLFYLLYYFTFCITPSNPKFCSAAGAPQAFQSSGILLCTPQTGSSLGSPTSTINQLFPKENPGFHLAPRWAFFPSYHRSGLKFLHLRKTVPAEAENRNIAHYLFISLYHQMKNTWIIIYSIFIVFLKYFYIGIFM